MMNVKAQRKLRRIMSNRNHSSANDQDNLDGLEDTFCTGMGGEDIAIMHDSRTFNSIEISPL